MASSPGRGSYVLGIDVGTTTVKACLVDTVTRRVMESKSQETKASVPSDLGPAGNEQDVHRILTALQFCVSRLPKEALSRVDRVAVSGQMHGCVLWKAGHGWRQNQHGRYEVDQVGCLYTWQDGRCTSEFLNSLPTPRSHLRLSTGHGCATLLWLLHHRKHLLTETYDRSATIQDLVVAALCDLQVPVMSSQNAASWGFYDTVSGTWNTDQLSEAGLPLNLLPTVVEPGCPAGKTKTAWYGVPAGVTVHAALGDMQCSVLSTLQQESDAVVNISTSAQMSFILPSGFSPTISEKGVKPGEPIEYFPYFDGRYLAVAASLNGGNVLAAFVKMLQQWTHELGLGVPESKIWERILTLAGEEDNAESSDPVIVPRLFGERHLPDQRASVMGLDPQSLGLGRVARALCKGLLSNLHEMMPVHDLIEANVNRILGSGTALTKNLVLQQELEKRYHGIPITYVTGMDAAVGAAFAVLNHATV